MRRRFVSGGWNSRHNAIPLCLWAKGVCRRGLVPVAGRGQPGRGVATPGQHRIILALGNGFHFAVRSCKFGMAAGCWGPQAGEWRRPGDGNVQFGDGHLRYLV